jgi:hypothetical protein
VLELQLVATVVTVREAQGCDQQRGQHVTAKLQHVTAKLRATTSTMRLQ